MQQPVEMRLVSRLDLGTPRIRSAARVVSDRDDAGGLELVVDVPTARHFCGVEEFGGTCGISRSRACELVARRELPSLRLGRRVLIPLSSLDELDGGPDRESA